MSGKTKIEWATDQWNPVTGCSKVSQGCKHCYAEREWPRLAAPRAKPNIYTGRAFTDVKCHPQKLDIPLRWTKPRRIFVNSMSDLFHESVPDEFVLRVFDIMRRCSYGGGAGREHVFQVLTKRPERMLAFAKRLRFNLRASDVSGDCALYLADDSRRPIVLKNVWLGISCEDQATADERIPLLLDAPAAVRWISAEPLLGPIDLTARMQWLKQFNTPPNINWVVVGGESGPQARPMHPDWARSLRDQCQMAGVPLFFKQWGEWAPLGDTDPVISQFGEFIGDKWLLNQISEQWPSEPMHRIGKKAAGRILDGRTWDEYPAQQN